MIYMYHTPPSRLYFIFTDNVHVSYTSVKALFHLYRRCTCILHLRKGFILTLQTIYLYHTPPSRLYFIFTDDVHASYTSVKALIIFTDNLHGSYTSVQALFHLYKRCTCIIHLCPGFISSLQTMYKYHTPPSRLFFIFTDDVHVSYTSVKALCHLYR